MRVSQRHDTTGIVVRGFVSTRSGVRWHRCWRAAHHVVRLSYHGLFSCVVCLATYPIVLLVVRTVPHHNSTRRFRFIVMAPLLEGRNVDRVIVPRSSNAGALL